MANWNSILTDERYLALDNEKKMSVARNFFNDFYEKDERYTGLEQRKKDTVKKKFYDSAVSTFEDKVTEKGAYKLGLEKIAVAGEEAFRETPIDARSLGIEARDERLVGDIATRTDPSRIRPTREPERTSLDRTLQLIRSMSALNYEAVTGGEIHERMSRDQAELSLIRKEYGKYAKGVGGNIVKGMASVPEVLLSAPVAITDTLYRAGKKTTGHIPEGMGRAEAAKEATHEAAGELLGWIGDIIEDPIGTAFENPELVAFAIGMGRQAVKGTVKGIDIVEGVKARKGAIGALREGFREPGPPRVPREVKKPIAKPTPTKADIVPDSLTEGGFIKVPKVEDIANLGKWAKENAKHSYRSLKEFFVPLSSVKSSELFLELRYKHLGALDRLESRVLKEHKRLDALGPETNSMIFKYLDGQYSPAVKELPYGKVKIKLQETGVRGRRKSLWVDIAKLEDRVAEAKAIFEKRSGEFKARLIHNKLKKKLDKLKKERGIIHTDIRKGTEYLDVKYPEIALENLFNDLKKATSEVEARKAYQAARNIRKLSNKAWDGYLDRGLIDLNAHARHMGNYVKYMYLKHIVGDKTSVPGTPSGKMDLSQLKARTDLTPEQRRAIGWVEDASIAGPVGVAQSWGDLMKYDYLNKIADNPDWVWEPSVVKVQTNMVNKKGQRITKKMSIHELSEEAKVAKKVSEAAPNNLEARQYSKRLNKVLEKVKKDTGNVPKDYVQMPNDIKYGPLRGAYIRKPIAQDLMPVVSITDTTMGSHLVAGAIRANQKLMSAFKVGKVALNPPTIIRNVGSNIVQANLSGTPLWDIPQYLADGFRHTLKKDALWGQARRHGIFKTNWGQAEIGEILGDLKKLEKKPYPDLLAGLQKIAEQYGKIDDFYKMAKFAERVRKGDSYAKAALEAQKWHMDYSLATPAIKVARANIAPFITYQYKVLPLLFEAAVKRPWVYAKYAMIPWIATQALLANTDLTKEDFDRLRTDLPTYLKNSGTAMPIPWKSPEGAVQWMNYEYFMPFGNAWTLAEDMKSFGAISPEASGPGDILRAIGIGNPIVDTVYGSLMMAKGTAPPVDTFTKRPVYNRLDNPEVKMKKMMYWLYTKWAPGAFTKEGALGKTMRIGKEDKYGRVVTPGQAAGSWVGLNLTAPTPEQADNYRKYFVGELQREVRKAMKNPEVSDEEVQTMQENLDKMLDELYK